jgi:hypothetical protein
MSRATPQMRHFARRLVAYETRGDKSSKTKTPAVFSVSEKLRPHLAALMGEDGYRALFSRALALASAEAPWLGAVQIKADGSFEELTGLATQIDARGIVEGKIALLAELLGLLVAFIGENLTLRLMREVWPKVPIHDLDLKTRDKNEKTK